MKKLLKISALFGASLLMFTGCEHPDTTEEMPYYYSESIAYLDNIDTHVAVYHSPDGIVNQDITMPVTVGVTKTLTNDCRVVLECTVESESEGLTADKIVLPESVTIPAGEKSVTVQMTVNDWSACAGVTDAASYKVSLKIVEASVRISTNMNSTVYTLDKTAMQYTSTDAPSEGSQVATDAYTVSYNTSASRPSWRTISLNSSGYYTNYPPYNYLYTYTYLGLQFDLGSAKTVTAVANFCYPYSTGYNACTYTIMTSVDGEEWTTYDEGVSLGQNEPQYVSFFTPVSARYVQLHMYGTTSLSTGALIFVK